MDSEKVIKRDNEYVLHTYNRNPIALEKGHGLYAEGPEGQKYLDFTSGIGVNSLGYCDLTWAEAVSEQAHKLQHTSNLYYTAPCGKLAKKLCKRTGMSKVFFGNSGAEANEGAIKAARKYSFDHYGKGRNVVITLVNSFHGRTIATLTATGQEVFHNYFGPFNEGFVYTTAGDIEGLRELVDRHTCAIMLELIQGEGGVMALDPEYVQAVRALCDEKDLVLIVDEVQTGVGRTGTFLCCEHYNLKPDIVTLAKGLGGGLPIGAVLLNEKTAEGMGPGSHGSTFGGNPVVCAGANVVVDRMDTSFLANVNDRAVQLRAGIAKLPHVKSISGIGLMVGIEFYDVAAADVLAACREKGLLVLTAKTRLRLLPPPECETDIGGAAVAEQERDGSDEDNEREGDVRRRHAGDADAAADENLVDDVIQEVHHQCQRRGNGIAQEKGGDRCGFQRIAALRIIRHGGNLLYIII